MSPWTKYTVALVKRGKWNDPIIVALVDSGHVLHVQYQAARLSHSYTSRSYDTFSARHEMQSCHWLVRTHGAELDESIHYRECGLAFNPKHVYWKGVGTCCTNHLTGLCMYIFWTDSWIPYQHVLDTQINLTVGVCPIPSPPKFSATSLPRFKVLYEREKISKWN